MAKTVKHGPFFRWRMLRMHHFRSCPGLQLMDLFLFGAIKIYIKAIIWYNHGIPNGRYWDSQQKSGLLPGPGKQKPWKYGYPLVNIQKVIENGHRNRGFTH